MVSCALVEFEIEGVVESSATAEPDRAARTGAVRESQRRATGGRVCLEVGRVVIDAGVVVLVVVDRDLAARRRHAAQTCANAPPCLAAIEDRMK